LFKQVILPFRMTNLQRSVRKVTDAGVHEAALLPIYQKSNTWHLIALYQFIAHQCDFHPHRCFINVKHDQGDGNVNIDVI
jgi:hypothetical protein